MSLNILKILISVGVEYSVNVMQLIMDISSHYFYF